MLFSMLAGCSTNTPQPDNQLCYKKLSSSASAPVQGSPGAAGLDLCSATALELQPGEIAVVPTDLAITVPAGTYGRSAPRSGFASKKIVLLGGVADPDYTGNVGLILGNIGTATLSVQLGHRIAQLICERIAVPVPTEVSALETRIRGNSGFGTTGITAVQVQPLELHEPINSATFLVLDGSLLSRLAFLWAGFLPQIASLFLYSAVQTGPGCSRTDCSNQSDRADPGCSSTASLPSCAVSLPPQSGRMMVGYRVQPEQRPVAQFEAEAQQLFDNLVCSEDPSGEADIFHIRYLQQWETEIPDCGSGRPGEAHGNRIDHPAALYPDDFMGGFGHSRRPSDGVLLAHMSASEDAP